MGRALLLGAGWAAVALALLGIFLPLLPTVPFLLLAAACFARSSPRCQRWLETHPLFGPPLLDWREQKIIRPAAKRRATLAIIASFGISIALVEAAALRIGLFLLMGGLLLFIWRARSG